MSLFTEATLLKMETFWVQRRKEWVNQPHEFWVLLDPSFLLKPTDEYDRKLYWRVAIVRTLEVLLILIIAMSIGLVILTLLYPKFWPIIHNPKSHAHLIGLLSREGFYQLPLFPLIIFSFSLLLGWPQRFFWNRRAKRLQREVLVVASSSVLAEAAAEATTTWPPPPRRTV